MKLLSTGGCRNLGLLLLRLFFGGLLAYAGWPKITGGPEFWGGIGQSIGNIGLPVFWPVFWGFMCAVAEFVGGLCVAAGFLYRPALVLLVCNMTVATASVIKMSGGDFQQWGRPLEVGVVFLALLIMGSGKWALDAVIWRNPR